MPSSLDGRVDRGSRCAARVAGGRAAAAAATTPTAARLVRAGGVAATAAPATAARRRPPRAACGCARSADFDAPVYVTSPPGDRARQFVVEQGGRVMVVRDGRKLGTPFLDIRDQVTAGGEQGLLSIAFAPDYAEQRPVLRLLHRRGRRPADRRVPARERRPRRPGLGAARAADGRLRVQPQRRPAAVRPRRPAVRRHRRRRRRRRPARPAAATPRTSARCSARSCGSTRARAAGAPYQVPDDNPFVGRSGARGEIYTYGLRNPWRFSFDRRPATSAIGDVGQNAFEEIDFVRARRGPRGELRLAPVRGPLALHAGRVGARARSRR